MTTSNRISLPMPRIAGTDNHARISNKVKDGIKIESRTTKCFPVYARMSEAESRAVLRDAVEADVTITQACLSAIATFWLNNAVPSGEDDKETGKLIRDMITDNLEVSIWGDDHAAVRKPDIWRKAKSKTSQVLTHFGDHAALFAQDNDAPDGDFDRDSVLSLYSLQALLPKVKRTDEEVMAAALKTINDEDMSGKAIQANSAEVLQFIRDAANILGNPAREAAGFTVPRLEPQEIIRDLLDDGHADMILTMVKAWKDAQAKAAKAAEKAKAETATA